MTVTPEISVLMANYNGERYLPAAIRSLQAQTFENWELLFVDDASRDASVEIATTFAKADRRIRVEARACNGGAAAARNAALAQAKGRWLAVFDSDDLMRPQRLETLLARAQADGAAIIADNLYVFAEDKEPRLFLPPSYVSSPTWIGLAAFIDSNRLYARAPDLGFLKPMFRSDLLKDNSIAYDERLRIGEDYHLMCRLLATGERIRLEPEAYYLYRKHSQSVSYRISVPALLAMIAADERLAEGVEPIPREVELALKRRRTSLETMLEYERVIQMLKSGHYIPAAAAGARSPFIWPLLSRPLLARLRRLAQALRSAAPPMPDAARAR